MPRAPRTTHQVIVIGAGIAGMAAATEASRCGLKTALFDDGLLGGLIANVGALHGHPGAEGATGAELVNTMLGEVMAVGVDYQPGAVTELSREAAHWSLPGATAPHVILATGAELRTLEVPGEAELSGRGVSQCAYCDGGLYRGQDVAVVGGGDAAFQEALHLAELCASVTMILRGRKPRARPVFVRAAADLKNLHFCWQTEVREIIGTDGVDGGVAAVELHDRDGGGSETLAIKAIFPFIGLAPRSGLVAAARDQSGGLVTDETLATDQPGLYAAGAVRAGHGGQIAHAIAEGKSAAQAVWRAGL